MATRKAKAKSPGKPGPSASESAKGSETLSSEGVKFYIRPEEYAATARAQKKWVQSLAVGSETERPSFPFIEQLKASSQYPRITAALSGLPNPIDIEDFWFLRSLIYALAGPRVHERFTRAERAKVAEKISSLARQLAQLLHQVHGDNEVHRDWPYEFQAYLDRMALGAALDFQEMAGSPGESELAAALADEDGEAFHAARFGIYHTLMECMPEVLEMLSDAAQFWKESGSQPLAKPHHKNAARLYFIRSMTSAFFGKFGRPMRALTLDLASVYFDCDDLDEAALSNLAPVTSQMRKLYEMEKRLQVVKVS